MAITASGGFNVVALLGFVASPGFIALPTTAGAASSVIVPTGGALGLSLSAITGGAASTSTILPASGTGGATALSFLLSGLVSLGGAILIVLFTPTPTGNLTITSMSTTSSPYAGPSPGATTTGSRTTYLSPFTPGGDPVYHNWNGTLGIAQSGYLTNVPRGDKIIWPYLSTGWIGYANTMTSKPFDAGAFMKKGGEAFLAQGLTTWDSFQLWFGKKFPSDWTDLGLTWDLSMLGPGDPRQNDRWKWDGFGWLSQPNKPNFDPDGTDWWDGGVHEDLGDYMHVMGNFAHSLAQKGTFRTAAGDLVQTFTNLYGGLTVVVKSPFGFDVWNQKQLQDFAWKRTEGATADPYTGIAILENERTTSGPPAHRAEEIVIWEPTPAPEPKRVPHITLTKKKRRMRCCPEILKKLRKIQKDLDKYLTYDLKGYFPPICGEKGTRNPLTGEPIVDWEDSLAVDSLVNVIAAGGGAPGGMEIPEIYADKGIAGLAAMIASFAFQVSDTAIATDRAKSLWCQVEESDVEDRVVLSGVSGIRAIDLPSGVDIVIFYVILEITGFEQAALRRFYLEEDHLSSPFPTRGWFGFASFLDDAYRSSLEVPINSSKIKINLPFPSKKIILRLEPSVVAKVSVNGIFP